MAACKKNGKYITVTIVDQKHIRKDWYFDFNGELFKNNISALTGELKKSGVGLKTVYNPDIVIEVNSYADLLNCVKISSSEEGHSNHCVGHIIGKSENLDIMADIAVAVRRIAFAPETVAPAGEFRKVCHNCGCGC